MSDAKAYPRILIVDDSKSVCHIFKEMCKVKGLLARIETCHDGNSAIDLLLDVSSHVDPFKLMIVDVFLQKDYAPDMTQIELGVKILTSYQLLRPGTPIMVITAYPNYEGCVRCLKAGAYDYLPKGDPSVQQSFIRTLVEKCRAILYPEPDQMTRWLRDNLAQISQRFAGSHIAIVSADSVKTSKLQSFPLGDKAIIAGKTMDELRILMLQDPVMRWIDPKILYVSVE